VSTDPTVDGLSREPSPPSGVRTGDGDAPELLEAIRRGDPEAFDRLAREYAPRLFRMAFRLTGRRDEAEDLVQDTLLRTIPALRKFEGRARLSTYLFRSLGNLWKNRLRSRKRSRIVQWFRASRDTGFNEAEEPVAVDPAPTAEDRLQQMDRAGAVREAVGRLEPTRRLTLLLREVEGLSYEEIAGRTGVAIGTVRSRLARARRELRTLIGESP